MFDLQKGYRIIDLSQKIRPGLLELNGDYTWSELVRRFHLRQFIDKHDQMVMHFVEAETHVGTHVEVPRHLKEDGKSCAEMPLENFFGEAIVLNFDSVAPKEGKGQAITPSDLSQVEEGDIVLMYSCYQGGECPYLSASATKHLVQQRIKMLGVTPGIGVEDPRSIEPSFPDAFATHKNILGNDIPLIENLNNMETIQKERVFFIGLPLNIVDLEASWIRAIALEPMY